MLINLKELLGNCLMLLAVIKKEILRYIDE